ncbi:MAG: hypothetical protein PHI16_02340 [Methanocellales archaeon]|nr:hypothetical protein [Methanocellales archaeon]
MNNEVSMSYRGTPYNFNEVKKLNLLLGQGYEKFAQGWNDKYLGIPKLYPLKLQGIISDILNENEQIKGIVEIGTYLGGLSCYLGAECIERGYKPLLTFDNKVRYEPKLFKALDVNFVVDDCFSKKSLKIIKEYVKDTPVLFICDGGNKAKEFNTFAPLLPPGSIVAVHDWDIEVNMEGIKETADRLKMFAIRQNQWNDEYHTLMAFFGIPDHKLTVSERTKVFIGIPTQGEIRTELANWLLEIVKNPNYIFSVYITGNSTICDNRNRIVRNFLKSDAEWLMTIDSDVSPSLDILDILKNGKKIIAPINFVWKTWGLAPLISTKVKDGKGYVVTDPAKANAPERLVEVDGTGTTCLFIHREVIEKMPPPWFMFGYDEMGKINLGEDYYFCQKAKELGYSIWIDKKYMTNHFKNTSLKSVNEYLIKEVKLSEGRLKDKFKEELGKYNLTKKE